MTSLIAVAFAATMIAMPVAALEWADDETPQDLPVPAPMSDTARAWHREDPPAPERITDERSFDVRPGEEHRFRIEVPHAYAIDAALEVGGLVAVGSGFSIAIDDACGQTAQGTSAHVAGRSRVTAKCDVLDAGFYTLSVHTGDSVGTGRIQLIGAQFAS